MLVFGAGTDYALLLVARYREELRLHADRHEAMTEALHRAGPAVLASGGTVILGMLCLLAATMNSTRGLGPVAAIGVGVTLAGADDPAPGPAGHLRPLGVLAGPPDARQRRAERDRFLGPGRARDRPRPRAVWVVTAALLACASLGLFGLDAKGLTAGRLVPRHARVDRGREVARRALPRRRRQPRATSWPAPTTPTTSRAPWPATDGIAAVAEPQVVGDAALIEATLADAADSEAAYDTIDRLRADARRRRRRRGAGRRQHRHQPRRPDRLAARQPGDHPADHAGRAGRAGRAAAGAGRAADPHRDGGAVLRRRARAQRADLRLDARASRRPTASFPLFVFVFLVALGIDYNIFLMTRVREEALDHGTRRAALIGLAATGGVITSAGLVLAATFAVLGTLPLTFITQLGIAVALGVLLDTIIVRSVLVTALNLDVGRWMWWPSALAQRLDEPETADAGEAGRGVPRCRLPGTPAPDRRRSALRPIAPPALADLDRHLDRRALEAPTARAACAPGTGGSRPPGSRWRRRRTAAAGRRPASRT